MYGRIAGEGIDDASESPDELGEQIVRLTLKLPIKWSEIEI